MFLWLFILQFSFSLVSPFPSEVENLNIPNSHIVEDSKSGVIVRGMRPRTVSDVNELLNIGITDILIFKNLSATETATEDDIYDLRDEKNPKLKQDSKVRVKLIPFAWKDIDSFKTACTQTIQALKRMKSVSKSKTRNLFFHCTVGEDRTGYLSAIYKILFQDLAAEKAWTDEMCENGYAQGNPRKPPHVVAEIHKNISPVFQKMLYKIKHGDLSADNLDERICSLDPEDNEDYGPSSKFTKCKASSKYDPTIE